MAGWGRLIIGSFTGSPKLTCLVKADGDAL